jgi:ribonuclease Z
MSEQIVMLGTGNAVVKKCFNTCFLLKTQNELLMVDAGGGNGILSQLDRACVNVTDIHNLFITHCHTDHILGAVWIVRMVTAAMLSDKYCGDFTVYSHKKGIDTLMTICNLVLPHKNMAYVGERVHLKVFENGDNLVIGELNLKCFDTLSTKEPQYGFRATLPSGKVLVCLGDEPFNEGNTEYVKGVDYLMCEAFCLYKDRDIFKPYQKHHSTAKDAAQLAQELTVKNLILYHTEDKTIDTRKVEYTNEAAQFFTGNIYVPEDLETIEL